MAGYRQRIRVVSNGKELVIPLGKRLYWMYKDFCDTPWEDLVNYDVRIEPMNNGVKGFTVVLTPPEKKREAAT